MPIDLERFCNFKDAEFRSLEVISPLHVKLSLAVQDKSRDFDWITLELDFTGVIDARLIEEKKLKYIDMSEGVSLFHVDQKFAFGIGACYNIQAIKNATLYIIFNDLKYKEREF